MSSSIASSELKRRWVAAAVLLAGAWALRPLEARQAIAPAGAGPSLAALGGFRAAAAGGCWLRVNDAWERRDAAATRAGLQLTVATDDRPLYFWRNGARMLAYDLPAWQRQPGQPEASLRRAALAAADEAQAFLEQGLQAHPGSVDLMIEIANIRLRGAQDVIGAAEWFRRAASEPRAPYYAARIHAELLRASGRPAEALAWLRQILPGLPADDPAAARAVVEQRIKALEAELAGK